MIHAVIIDDEIPGIKYLEVLIERFEKDVKVVATATDPEEGVRLIDNYRPDIVFLDICMPGLDGFELLQQLQFRDFHLVFTTALPEYGIKAIKHNAVGYLLKPTDPEEIHEVIEKVRTHIDAKKWWPDVLQQLMAAEGEPQARIQIPSKDRIDYVSADEIMYIEADANSVRIAMQSGEVMSACRSLKQYELLLCHSGSAFMRVHNSFIVNVNHVARYLREDTGYVVVGKKIIPVSKQKKAELSQAIKLPS
jgi:two-component system, LytTR family, response regulator